MKEEQNIDNDFKISRFLCYIFFLGTLTFFASALTGWWTLDEGRSPKDAYFQGNIKSCNEALSYLINSLQKDGLATAALMEYILLIIPHLFILLMAGTSYLTHIFLKEYKLPGHYS